MYTPHNYGDSEIKYKNFIAPSVTAAIEELNIPPGATILDAGCGPGSTIYSLIKATNFSGHVYALDASQPHLQLANETVNKYDLQDKVTLVNGDLFKPLPFKDNFFDVIWFSDVLFPDDTGLSTEKIIADCIRILKPGGTLAIFYGNWLRLQLLSGYSLLEHYISIANELRKSTEQQWTYNLHPENAVSWLIKNSFKNCNASFQNTFYQAPLREDIEEYIYWHLTNIYNKAIHYSNDSFKVPDELIALWNRLIDIESANYILRQNSYYCSANTLLVRGTK